MVYLVHQNEWRSVWVKTLAKLNKNVLINISYHGTKFHGYAVQNDYETVQSKLQDALAWIYESKIYVNASGRTDKGVHAINQYISFYIDDRISLEKLREILNRYGQNKWYIKWIKEVDRNFHARFSAKAKTYFYLIDYCANNPLFYDHAWIVNFQLDFNLIEKAIPILEGTHNFWSFSTADKDKGLRTIHKIDLKQEDNKVYIYITGDGFLRSMVRMIVGALYNIGIKKYDLNHLKWLLDNPKKGRAITKAPASGLYLYEVYYE
ncbi:tRNA pseudouridine synthase A [Mycoplasmoides gallisepticum CA06_2006.052-5-2P]|uniref:tRNA pseudouridine synthase A n=1 Tax=Mycoplasmoides gallisepticum WI01_2001.043-13-2P TaxID=1159201 RepID=J3VHF0_MYCGL|nr:tRNA pseudouridine(38-40) synthase TruA [Mycoplasmoides gallisepticum]AFP76146.1 tRNA pseudouridine synthase A [Mycoplasmoides gallisepticum VA94_7994-1-7P]AFP76913.1 tRNA pseudouridine synthase A [Mycoplasmoides gallisepticum NC95_13295-2-2P]AFP77671.1 tRNA pseudouridine synthase A [Mycoplasmoides gallisepticum NC96_1596-4-2P]AFP78438.1 tRNA pseudouridine synthase A [Mycoplasmoides gallisepticum NY01_2001.047-5-1P]AFP79198.1 tRNA pseudouridine synthase A [Mycoplasmoides gallisepticum WI01_